MKKLTIFGINATLVAVLAFLSTMVIVFLTNDPDISWSKDAKALLFLVMTFVWGFVVYLFKWTQKKRRDNAK